jgi:hypothetical protein
MDSTIVEDSKHASEKIGSVAVKTSTTIVDGSRTLVHNGAKDVAEGATVVADATKTVVRDGVRDVVVAAQVLSDTARHAVEDVSEAGKDAGRDVKKVISPPPGAVKPSTEPDAVVPSA